MEAVKYNSEGQISHALYDVAGEYRGKYVDGAIARNINP
jgi:hypothetical protein